LVSSQRGVDAYWEGQLKNLSPNPIEVELEKITCVEAKKSSWVLIWLLKLRLAEASKKIYLALYNATSRTVVKLQGLLRIWVSLKRIS
jgi:hypothetical protein